MSTTSSISDVSNADSSSPPQEGLLFVTVSIRHPDMTKQMVEDWYGNEHMNDVLNCPGNGGLFLRYGNNDPSIAADNDLGTNMAGRANAELSEANIAAAGWPYLSLVKVPDLAWYTSAAFSDMPRTSKIFPPHADGTLTNAFEAFYASLRSYATLSNGPVVQAEGYGKFLVILQTSSVDEDFFKGLDEKIASQPNFMRAVRYRNANGYLAAQEPGVLPEGLMIYHFDGASAPDVQIGNDTGVVRQDIWRFTEAKGDLSLVM